MADLIAGLLGLPDWAPTLIKRCAGWTLIACAIFFPVTFRHGLEVFVTREVERSSSRCNRC